MAASLGDLLRVTDRGVYLGQRCLNVYFYRVTSITGLVLTYLQDLHDEWVTNVVTPVLGLQADEFTHVEAYWENLTNGVDILTAPMDLDGTVSVAVDDCLPSYVSVGFQLIRESRATGNGYKRYSGIPEGAVSGNDPSYNPAVISAVEDGLAADLVLGIITVAEPVIVQHPLPAVPISSYIYSSIGEAHLRGLGTQLTRKVGRGV